ncbi:hypothetical protein PP175_08040 [Aneurinibacillus sp. Ricciae_BoGa-3]|uniref:hypothetical protein n=1 Tax=Aneurinibacillus sp. Ricciae_BoGa-3 TaxID=3022697 RepID=UPI00234141FA|nr:hypothetical protein [Aneurinibacillus sp. Ricciae_BoGa-3]WCK55864.1 hypothetical protein PP175_08040 [Aneurinibacillus sp. Ricciae_BoGa-3]
MSNHKFSYENNIFSSLEEMTDILLHEANEQIILIDIGDMPNNGPVRNYIKWRLLHLQYYFKEQIPNEIRSTYNSLWSQLYRLEHQDEYRHPYLKQVMELLHA